MYITSFSSSLHPLFPSSLSFPSHLHSMCRNLFQWGISVELKANKKISSGNIRYKKLIHDLDGLTRTNCTSTCARTTTSAISATPTACSFSTRSTRILDSTSSKCSHKKKVSVKQSKISLGNSCAARLYFFFLAYLLICLYDSNLFFLFLLCILYIVHVWLMNICLKWCSSVRLGY